MVMLTLLLACQNEPQTSKVLPEMAPLDLLTRASLDLRGRRPSLAEIQTVEANPEALDGLIDEMMQDPDFGARVRDLFADIYRTRTESYYVSASAYGLVDSAGFLAAVGEEPLYILSTVAEEDLPWTTIVTADWTLSNELLAAAWPLDYSGTGWQKAHYTDGRPTAGVLSTNGLWWRYVSTASNANRARANAVSRILLCHDYLSRPIDFDRNVNLLDEEAVNDALKSNPGCVNCHNSLDPLAGYFWGFFYYNYADPKEAAVYHPEREQLWRSVTEVQPGYYGETGWNLKDLAQQIASDNRFVECAVQQVYEGLLRRDVTLEDENALTRHREAFLEGGLTLRALLRSVIDDPRYRAADREGVDEAGGVPRKMATPALLASQVEALTGYRMSSGGYDLMTTDLYGLRTLAGGADGYNVTQSASSPNTTLLLTQERLAEAAAWYVAEADAAAVQAGDSPTLFQRVDFTETPETGRAAMVAQLQDLHLALFADRQAEDSEAVLANLALWEDLYAVGHDPVDAWAGVLSVLLRDPELLLY